MKANAPNDFYTCIAPIRMAALKSMGATKADFWKPILQLPDHLEKMPRSDRELIGMEVVAFLHDRYYTKYYFNIKVCLSFHQFVHLFDHPLCMCLKTSSNACRQMTRCH